MADAGPEAELKPKSTTSRRHFKLRRERTFEAGEGIQSQLPSSEHPESRAVKPKRPSHLSHEVVDARGGSGPLPLRDVVDRIVCGDSASTLERLPEQCVTLAITSPPYWNLVDYGFEGQIGVGTYGAYRRSLKEVWKQVARCLRPNGKFALNVPLMPIRKEVSERYFGPTHTRYLIDLYADLRSDILEETDLLAYSLFIWEKQTTEKMFGSYPFPPNLYERNYIEFIAVFVKPGPPPKVPAEVKSRARLSQHQWMELTNQIWWMYPENVARAAGHPAPFPEALPNRLINMYTFPRVEQANFSGDLVLDPFAGWGTTCVAAKRLGRAYVGVDLSEGFCNRAQARLNGTHPAVGQLILPATRPQKVDPRQRVLT